MSLSKLDQTDTTILHLLQQDGHLSNPKLAEQVSLSVTPLWRRLKRLEDAGYIRDYQANLDRRKLGLDILAFVQLSFTQASDTSAKRFEQAMAAHPAVLCCHKVTGSSDYMLQVVASNLDAYSNFVEQDLRYFSGLGVIHSSLSMREIKHTSRLPVIGMTASRRRKT